MGVLCLDRVLLCSTVDSEILAKILSSRITVNDIFVTSKIRDKAII